MDPNVILWRRLDTPGHDACRLVRRADGWCLAGAAVFRHAGAPAHLSYDVACDSAWRAEEGHVRGWLGARTVDLSIARSSQGTWTLDGAPVSGLRECLDLDFGFTPATNLLQLRRLNLAEGQAAEAPAAWLDVAAGTLNILSQRYERRSDRSYWYEAPDFGYAALLETTPTGFVSRYPGLWEAEGRSLTDDTDILATVASKSPPKRPP